MPRFAANLTLLFQDHPLPKRFQAAAAAGFRGIELLLPYALPAPDLQRHLHATGLELVLINTPVPDWDQGARGCAAQVGQTDRFRREFTQALHYAQTLGQPLIHIMPGLARGPRADAQFIDNLTWATAQAPDLAMTIEPINPIDMPGYFLSDFAQAARILDQVGAANLHLQFDAYHAHHITGDMPGCWARYGHLARHIQIAAAEGRHEPAGGIIDYPAFFAQLDRDGYHHWVSGEYLPAGRTEDGLSWAGLEPPKGG